MFKNKVLSAAIVAALSTGAQAGEFALYETNCSDTTKVPAEYASEQFAASGTEILDYQFCTEYTLANTISTGIYVKFALSDGTWGANLGSSALEVVKSDGSTTKPSVSLVENGQTDQSDVEFLVSATQANSLSPKDELKFKFKIGGVAGVLSNAGTPIKLDVSFKTAVGSTGIPDEPKSLTVVSSSNGAVVDLKKDSKAGEVAIDVARGGTVFLGGFDDTTVSLGTVDITVKSLRDQTDTDGTKNWSFDASEGTLTIRDGIFAASTPETVYLELVAPETELNEPSDTNRDIHADSVDPNEATWKLSSAELIMIKNSANPVPIIVKANGTSVINENGNPPNATLTIKYQTDAVFTGKLRHIKRNGQVCKLYNIPNPNATDALSIRITNKTSLQGLVLGTLTTMDGEALFTNQTLIETLEPQNTVRLSIDNLVEKLPEGTTTWPGRAVLTLNSDLTDMEVFGLVRNKAGGPLMNMSKDASGNTCD
jgi:hypothetical protein